MRIPDNEKAIPDFEIPIIEKHFLNIEIPIYENPDSQRWEFPHMRSAFPHMRIIHWHGICERPTGGAAWQPIVFSLLRKFIIIFGNLFSCY